MNIIITGLITGSMLALLAISFSLIFGVARIVNIAHTAFYMVAAYCIFSLTGKFGAQSHRGDDDRGCGRHRFRPAGLQVPD